MEFIFERLDFIYNTKNTKILETLSDLFTKNLNWAKDINETAVYRCSSLPKEIFLRMNDFPDEQLYSLISKKESLDFDDLPDGWEIEY